MSGGPRSVHCSPRLVHKHDERGHKDLIEHLHDLLPAEKSITTARISKRALAPFVGWVMRGLFGTATEDELLPIETQIRRIPQGVVMMAEGLEVQKNRLVGFMSMAVDDINNIINMTVYQQEEIRQLRELLWSS